MLQATTTENGSASAMKFVPSPQDAAEAIARHNTLTERWEAAGGDAAAFRVPSTDAARPPAEQTSPIPKPPWAYAVETIGEAALVPGLVAAVIAYAAVCWAIVRWAVGVFKGGPLW